MADLRNIMSGIFTKAQEWEILPDRCANPMRRVKLPRKWEVREKRILSEEQTACVLARLEDPHLLIAETCIDTGTRISEVTGLKIKNINLDAGSIRIEQRNWRGDIDEPKTAKSRRTLALGTLVDRYRVRIASLKNHKPEDWVFPQKDDPLQPMWDSGVRKALKLAAEAEKCDFPGFGPHSLVSRPI
jgi:integrase